MVHVAGDGFACSRADPARTASAPEDGGRAEMMQVTCDRPFDDAA